MSSRLQVPTQRSAVPFCHGLLNAVRFGLMPSARIDFETSSEKMESLSKIKSRGAESSGNASRSCWLTHGAVGLVVTLK